MGQGNKGLEVLDGENRLRGGLGRGGTFNSPQKAQERGMGKVRGGEGKTREGRF